MSGSAAPCSTGFAIAQPRRGFDPDGVEWSRLRAAVSFEGARVLEVGSGGGRLSAACAGSAAHVVGVDFDPAVAADAQRARPEESRGHLHFAGADARRLPFRSNSFDIALLGWSL